MPMDALRLNALGKEKGEIQWRLLRIIGERCFPSLPEKMVRWIISYLNPILLLSMNQENIRTAICVGQQFQISIIPNISKKAYAAVKQVPGFAQDALTILEQSLTGNCVSDASMEMGLDSGRIT